MRSAWASGTRMIYLMPKMRKMGVKIKDVSDYCIHVFHKERERGHRQDTTLTLRPSSAIRSCSLNTRR